MVPGARSQARGWALAASPGSAVGAAPSVPALCASPCKEGLGAAATGGDHVCLVQSLEREEDM